MMARYGIRAEFDNLEVKLILQSDCHTIATGFMNNSGLYALDILTKESQHGEFSLNASQQVWHERIGHVSTLAIKKIAGNGEFEGLKISSERCRLARDAY